MFKGVACHDGFAVFVVALVDSDGNGDGGEGLSHGLLLRGRFVLWF